MPPQQQQQPGETNQALEDKIKFITAWCRGAITHVSQRGAAAEPPNGSLLMLEEILHKFGYRGEGAEAFLEGKEGTELLESWKLVSGELRPHRAITDELALTLHRAREQLAESHAMLSQIIERMDRYTRSRVYFHNRRVQGIWTDDIDPAAAAGLPTIYTMGTPGLH